MADAMVMGRPRTHGREDLPRGFYAPDKPGASWRCAHPITGKRISLDTADKAEALALYDAMKAMARAETEASKVERLMASPAAQPPATAANGAVLLGAVAKDYREKVLPKATTKRGKPLSEATRHNYGLFAQNLEEADIGREPIASFGAPETGPVLVRKYLADWLIHPAAYNYRLACLSGLFRWAVDRGDIARNPCADIDRRGVVKREVYVSDADYLKITGELAKVHEVYAKACDLLYLVSHRPTDVLGLREDQVTDAAGDQLGELRFTAAKNDQPVVIQFTGETGDIQELISWLRRYKAKEGIVSPYLVVHPLWAHRKLACRPVTTEQLYRLFVEAQQKAGIATRYTLRDLRPKGLTDEAEIAGEATNKGGHKTEAMRRHYVKKRLPVVAQNRLRAPKRAG